MRLFLDPRERAKTPRQGRPNPYLIRPALGRSVNTASRGVCAPCSRCTAIVKCCQRRATAGVPKLPMTIDVRGGARVTTVAGWLASFPGGHGRIDAAAAVGN